MRPSVTVDEQHRLAGASRARPSHAYSAPVAPLVTGTPAPRVRSASAITPATQSSSAGVLGRGVRDTGGVANEQHGGRDARGGEDSGVVAGPGRQDRRAAPSDARRARSRSAVSNSTTGVNDSAVDVERGAVAAGALRAGLLDAVDDGVQRGLVGGPGVEPAA